MIADHLITNLQSNALLVRILEATVKGSVLLTLALAASRMLRNRSAALRHMIWVVATSAAIAVLVLPSVVPAWRVLPVLTVPGEPSTSAAAVSRPTMAPSVEDLGQARSAESSPRPQAAPTTRSVRTRERNTQSAMSIAQASNVSSQAVNGSDSQLAGSARSSRGASWSMIALSAWLAGFVFWAGYYCLGWLKVRELMLKSSPVVDAEWTSRAESARRQLQIRRPVTLMWSSETEVPLTFGVLYPKIILPADAHEWSAQRKHAVIQHEMAHIARLDALTQLVSHAASALYWFNPLVWVAARQVRFERERACDDHVLAAGSAASDYANDLLTMVSSFRKSEHYAVALAMARKSQLEGRLVALLNPKLSRQGISLGTALWVAGIAVALVLPLSAMGPADSAQANPAKPVIAPSGVTGPNPVVATTPALAPAASSGQSDEANPAFAPAVPETATQSDEARPAVAAERPDMDVHEGVGIGVGGGVGGGVVGGVAGGVGRGIGRGVGTENGDSRRDRKTVVAIPPAERLTGFECHQGKGSSSSNMHQSDGAYKSWKVKWTGDGCSFSLDAQGEVTFNNDFTAFESISNGGYVDITWRIRGDVYGLNVRPVFGQLKYRWVVNDTARNFDAEGQKWLANLLIAMDRQSAIGIKQRFPKLLQEGGVRRVLEEVSYMDSDYARAAYLLKVVQDVQLKPEELQATLARSAEMSSDYECARVLMAVAGKYSLQDAASRNAFLNAIETIESDYEHARVLMAFFSKGRVPTELTKTVLDSASRIKSDYEHARVLLAFFDNGSIPPEMSRSVLESAAQLKSDYEHARVLVEMCNRNLVDAKTQSDFLVSVNAIKGDYEHARTLVAFLNARKNDDAAVLGVIQSVPSIKSDYEAARVLGVAASGRRLEGSLREAYIHAAQGIGSEHDRTQALAAVGYRQASL